MIEHDALNDERIATYSQLLGNYYNFMKDLLEFNKQFLTYSRNYLGERISKQTIK